MSPADADTERRLFKVEKMVEEDHERLRPIESRVMGDGWDSIVQRLDKAESRAEKRAEDDDARYNKLDRSVVKLNTTIVMVGAAVVVVLPLINEFFIRLIGK